MKIRQAQKADVDNILAITRACAMKMNSEGILQWNEHYPSSGAFETDIRRNELFVLEIDEVLAGCVVVSTFMDEIYQPINWLTPSTKNIYIHRLAVHPEFQGRGYAQQLMDFAEHKARESGAKSVRLDTFSKNPGNNKFYQKRGYQKLEAVYFPKQSEHPFYCYELPLKK